MKQSREERKKKKIIKIIISILLFVIPVPAVVIFDINYGFPSEKIYMMFCVFASILTFIGFIVGGMTLTGFDDSDNSNSILIVAGKKIDLEKTKKMSFLEKIKEYNILNVILRILAIPAFLFVILLLLSNTQDLFPNVENIGRCQFFAIYGVIFVVNTVYFIYHRQRFKKFHIVLYIIINLIAIILGYLQTETNDIRQPINYIEFRQYFLHHDYYVSEVSSVENTNLSQSNIYLAEKDDIKVYFIISDNIKIARQNKKTINYNYKNECISGKTIDELTADYEYLNCEYPNFTKVLSRVRNTIIYANIKFEDRQNVEQLLYNLGYGYLKK